MTLTPELPFRLARFDLDWLRRSRANRANRGVLSHHPRHVTLTFTDALHLHRDLSYELFDAGPATRTGTTVELEIPCTPDAVGDFVAASRAALVRWCRHAAVPIVLVTAPLYAAFPDEHDWGEFAYYAGFFVAGFVLMSDTRLMAAVRRDLVPALALGIAGFLALIVGDVEGFIDRRERSTPYS